MLDVHGTQHSLSTAPMLPLVLQGSPRAPMGAGIPDLSFRVFLLLLAPVSCSRVIPWSPLQGHGDLNLRQSQQGSQSLESRA